MKSEECRVAAAAAEEILPRGHFVPLVRMTMWAYGIIQDMSLCVVMNYSDLVTR